MTLLIDEPRVPRGRFAVFRSLHAAEAFQQEINIAMGIPNVGVYMGTGIHTPLAQGATTNYDCLWTHPKHKLWAYAINGSVESVIRRRSFPIQDLQIATLDSTWAGAGKVIASWSLAEAMLRRFLHRTPRLPRRSGRVVADVGTLANVSLANLASNTLSPREFEEGVARIFLARQFAVFLGAGSKDGGADLVAATVAGLTPSILLVQCKCNAESNPVGESVIKALLADVVRFNATAGLVVTTSRFTDGAKRLAHDYAWRISLWDRGEVSTRYVAHVIEGHD